MSVGLKSSQIYRILHEKIVSGEMAAGCRLPPEKERAQTAAEFLLNGDYRQEALHCPPIQIRERESIRSIKPGEKL